MCFCYYYIYLRLASVHINYYYSSSSVIAFTTIRKKCPSSTDDQFSDSSRRGGILAGRMESLSVNECVSLLALQVIAPISNLQPTRIGTVGMLINTRLRCRILHKKTSLRDCFHCGIRKAL